jgi:biopolymer transport protein ExbD
MSLRPERHRRHGEINIVPLVDVLTTLIFFFLVTMQFRNAETVNVVLPDIETAGKNTLPASIDITITKEGEYFYNESPVTREDIQSVLADLAKLARENRSIPVVIRADEKTALENVTFMMDACRKNGFDDFRLQSR